MRNEWKGLAAEVLGALIALIESRLENGYFFAIPSVDAASLPVAQQNPSLPGVLIFRIRGLQGVLDVREANVLILLGPPNSGFAA
jgi:hypothetical protein